MPYTKDLKSIYRRIGERHAAYNRAVVAIMAKIAAGSKCPESVHGIEAASSDEQCGVGVVWTKNCAWEVYPDSVIEYKSRGDALLGVGGKDITKELALS